MSMPGMPDMDKYGKPMAPMPGMLTSAQMEALRSARGAEFDRLFLTGMIQHHNGALIMVKDLFDQAGAGQDADIFQLRDGRGQHATGRNQNHAKHAGGEALNQMKNVAFCVATVAAFGFCSGLEL